MRERGAEGELIEVERACVLHHEPADEGVVELSVTSVGVLKGEGEAVALERAVDDGEGGGAHPVTGVAVVIAQEQLTTLIGEASLIKRLTRLCGGGLEGEGVRLTRAQADEAHLKGLCASCALRHAHLLGREKASIEAEAVGEQGEVGGELIAEARHRDGRVASVERGDGPCDHLTYVRLSAWGALY